MKSVLYIQILDVVNMVSRGVLQRYIGCFNHGTTWIV